MTTLNLNCILPSGTTPSGVWTDSAATVVTSPTTLDITNFTTGNYVYRYTVGGSGSCAVFTDYTIGILAKPIVGTPVGSSFCNINGTLSNGTNSSITIPVTFTGSWKWSVDQISATKFSSISGESSRTNSGNIVIPLVTTSTGAITETITLKVESNAPHSTTTCITYTPALANPCEVILAIPVTVADKIFAGTPQPTNSICSNALTVDLNTFFQANSSIVPSGYVIEYFVNGSTVASTTPSAHTLSATPTTQSITRTVRNSAGTNTCTSSATASVTITTAPNAGTATTITVCN